MLQPSSRQQQNEELYFSCDEFTLKASYHNAGTSTSWARGREQKSGAPIPLLKQARWLPLPGACGHGPHRFGPVTSKILSDFPSSFCLHFKI
jgi:hypothetical protein